MFFKKEKIERYLKDLKSVLNQQEIEVRDLKKYPASIQDKAQPDFSKLAGKDFKVGEWWGGKNKSCWFKTEITVPDSWIEQEGNIYLEIIPGKSDPGGLSGTESLLYLNGRVLQGLDRNHTLVKLDSRYLGNKNLNIAVKAFSGLKSEKQQFRKAALIFREQNLEEFYRLAETLQQSIDTMAAGQNLRQKLLN